MEHIVKNITQTVEKQLDAEIERLNNLDTDDLGLLREQRIAEMKKRVQMKQEWKANGHGEYSELTDEKEFFAITKKSKDIICHFYKSDSPRCKIVDMHLRKLAVQHMEVRCVRLDVERCPFLTERLRIRVIPTIALVKDSKTTDFIVGFTDLGNCDDFTTEMLEWRIARSGVIEYSGDLMTPPDQARKEREKNLLQKRTIRSKNDDDDDFSD